MKDENKENKFILKAAQDKEVDKNQEPIKKEDEVYQKLILQYKIKKYSKYLWVFFIKKRKCRKKDNN